MGESISVLRISAHVVARCPRGALEAETALFHPPVGALATTTVSEARARLGRSGLTPATARAAVDAIDPEALASYARAECVRAVMGTLDAAEILAGAVFDRDTASYEGAWFDLRALAADLRIKHAGLVLQGLFLVAFLEPLAGDVGVSLEHGGGGDAARVAFLKPHAVLEALARLPPRTTRVPGVGDGDHDDEVRAELSRDLRDRAAARSTPRERQRLAAIEQALAELDKPRSGPLSHPALWTVERQLRARDLRGALERIQAYVRAHGGESPATRYLRAHLALLEGVEPPRRIAEDLLDERRPGPPFHELELLKARAWMAAGGWTYARHFARALMNDPNAPDFVSLGAFEIFEASNQRGVASEPAARSVSGAPLTPSPIVLVSEAAPASPSAHPPDEPPATQRLHEPARRRPDDPDAPAPGVAPRRNSPIDSGPRASADRDHVTEPPPATLPSETSDDGRPRARYVPEEVEHLSLPDGMTERQLAEGATAQSGNEVRIVSTRYSRLLGREYRERYGVTLRVDVQAIDWMQRHLVAAWGDSGVVSSEAEADVRRHGALLSEILARTLGARWVDVAPTEIGYWAMVVPPRTRCWPFGRTYRLLTLGHRQKDLVGYYLDLAARARQG